MGWFDVVRLGLFWILGPFNLNFMSVWFGTVFTDVFEMVFTHFCYTIILRRVGKYYEIKGKALLVVVAFLLLALCFSSYYQLHTLPAISRDERNGCIIKMI